MCITNAERPCMPVPTLFCPHNHRTTDATTTDQKTRELGRSNNDKKKSTRSQTPPPDAQLSHHGPPQQCRNAPTCLNKRFSKIHQISACQNPLAMHQNMQHLQIDNKKEINAKTPHPMHRKLTVGPHNKTETPLPAYKEYFSHTQKFSACHNSLAGHQNMHHL